MGYCNSYWGHYKSAVNLKLSGAERRVISLDGRTEGWSVGLGIDVMF